jgi:transcriptional regulator GlxA family with amidase domain
MRQQQVGLLVLPRASMLAAGALLDLLTQANEELEMPLYRTRLLALDGELVLGAGGGALVAEGTVAQQLRAGPLDVLLVLADTPLPESGFEPVLDLLRQQAAAGALVGGVGTGAWLLARAGLLDGRRATIHWPYTALFGQRFARTVVSDQLYEIGEQRLSCGGGTAVIDALLAWLQERHGEPLAQALASHFGLERLRGRDERQRVPLAARIGGGQPKLAEAVSLMEPLPTEEIAQLVGVSRRQLERLFKQHLDALPSRYYLELRLNHARRLLQQTSQSILQIGLSCGFSSGPHFSSAYRNHFGMTPREQRSGRAAAQVQSTPDMNQEEDAPDERTSTTP